MVLGLIMALPNLILYEAAPIGVAILGVALLVWVLTSLGSRRSRSRSRVVFIAGGLVGGTALIVLGFMLALSSAS